MSIICAEKIRLWAIFWLAVSFLAATTIAGAAITMPLGFSYPTQLAWTGTGDTQQPPGKSGLFGWMATDQDDFPYPVHKSHRGIDIYGASGSPVYAITNGTVAANETALPDYIDKHLWIKHVLPDGTTFYTVYGHVDSPLAVGTPVSAGQQIATITPQGNPHVHLGIHPSGISYPWGRGIIPELWSIKTDPSKQALPQDGWVAPRTFLESHFSLGNQLAFGSTGNTALSIEIAGPLTSVSFDPPQTIAWSVTDPGIGISLVTLQWDSQSPRVVRSSGTTEIPPGNHMVTIRAADTAGNMVTKTAGPFIVKSLVVTVAPWVLQDRFYVQWHDGSSGMAIQNGAAGTLDLIEGDQISISGGTIVHETGEPRLSGAKIKVLGQLDSPPSGIRRAISELAGPANGSIGLLVTTTGNVTFVDPTGKYFYIDDGSNSTDGIQKGIKVICNGTADNNIIPLPKIGESVSVTGICTVTKVSKRMVHAIVPRRHEDVSQDL